MTGTGTQDQRLIPFRNKPEERREMTMCCTTLIALGTPMATTQVMRARYDILWPQTDKRKTPFQPVRMNWVVVTDENGNRRLKMDWHADRGE